MLDISALNVSLEEADVRLIPHALHASQNSVTRIVVLSADTDVIVLLLYYWRVLHTYGLQELWIKGGVGDSTRYIPIHILAKLHESICPVIVTIHTITGCDLTSKVGAKSAALKAHPTIYLTEFAKDVTDEDNYETVEQYLVQVLKQGSHCKTMDQLRYWMYHHSKSMTISQLPPTSYAMQIHIRRAAYAANEMMTCLDPNIIKPDPVLYGFEFVDNLLMPRSGSRTIPESYAQFCNCLKCVQCECRKQNIPCCLFCKCHSQEKDHCKNSL